MNTEPINARSLAALDARDHALAVELLGRPVVTRHSSDTPTYRGPDGPGATNIYGGRGEELAAHPAAVAPADEVTVRAASDPVAKARITAEKFDGRAYGAPSWIKWRACLDGLPISRGKTKADVTATALRALAVAEWHAARAAKDAA